MSLPNFIIAGVTKGGTTALFRYMAEHPDVCPSLVKETCHFLPLRYGNPLPPIEQYEQQFRKSQGQRVLMESTPGYYYGGADLAQAIADAIPDVKVMVVFREPTARFFSFFHFTKNMQQLPADLSVETYLDQCLERDRVAFRENDQDPWFGVEGGLYVDYLQPWVELFGDRLQLSFFDDLVADQAAFLRRVSEFCDLDPAPFNSMEFAQENKSRSHKNALLHGVALKVYGAISPALNRNPTLKKGISRLYNTVNEAPIERDAEAEARVRSRLESYYADPNARFAAALSALPEGMVAGPLPKWLAS